MKDHGHGTLYYCISRGSPAIIERIQVITPGLTRGLWAAVIEHNQGKLPSNRTMSRQDSDEFMTSSESGDSKSISDRNQPLFRLGDERPGHCTFFAWNSSSNCFAAVWAASWFCFAMECCTWDWPQFPPDMAPAMAPIMPAASAEPCSIFFRVPSRTSLLSCSARNGVRTRSLVNDA